MLFRACARTVTALEVNAHPDRLDLPADHMRAARDAGVLFAVDAARTPPSTWATCVTASAPRAAAG